MNGKRAMRHERWRLRRPVLFRRRELWVPTPFTALLLCIGAAALAWLLIVRVHAFLALNQAAAGASLLVVEGWLLPGELDQAVQAFQRGGYRSVITAGGPIDNHFYRSEEVTFAERARRYLVERGIPSSSITAVPAPASPTDRTYQSAVSVQQWLQSAGTSVTAFDLFSCGTHSRRSRQLYAMAFGPDVTVGALAATPDAYDPGTWWRTSAGAKAVLTESVALVWTTLLFNPTAPES